MPESRASGDDATGDVEPPARHVDCTPGATRLLVIDYLDWSGELPGVSDLTAARARASPRMMTAFMNNIAYLKVAYARARHTTADDDDMFLERSDFMSFTPSAAVFF